MLRPSRMVAVMQLIVDVPQPLPYL